MNTIDWVKFVLKEVMWDKSLRYSNFVKVASIQNYEPQDFLSYNMQVNNGKQ